MEGMHETEIFVMDGFEVGKVLGRKLGAVDKAEAARVGGHGIGVGGQRAVGISHRCRPPADGNIEETGGLRTGSRISKLCQNAKDSEPPPKR